MKIKLLSKDAIYPTKGSAQSAGWDLYSTNEMILKPMDRYLFGTGVKLSIIPGYFGSVRPRSGLALHHGIDVMAGTIDSDYRGEIKVLLINLGQQDYVVNAGDKIAQLIIQPYCRSSLINVEDLDITERNKAGFGSTGR